MHLLQKSYSIILNPICRATAHVDEKVKNALITLSSMGLIIYFVAYFAVAYQSILRRSHTMNTLICSAILLVLIIFSIKDELRTVKWNKLVFYTFFAAGAGVMGISFLHPIGSGYRAWAMLMMFGFPCVYYVWSNRGDYDELYKRLSAATVIVGILYYLYCLILAGRGGLTVIEERMNGTFYDANMFSMIGMIMADSAIYMLLVNRHSKAWFALTVIGFGAGVDITLLGQSRLAVLAVLGAMLAFSIYYLKIRKDPAFDFRRGKSYLRALTLLLSLVLFLMTGTLMKEINQRAINEMNNVSTSSLNFVAPAAAAAPGADDETAGGNDAGVLDRFKPEGSDIDSYTAGRYQIWRGYAQFLNLTGNDFSETDWGVLTNNTVKHAHNNFLEIGYRCGVPVAVIHTLLELIAGVICIIFLFGRRYKEPYYLFCIVFMITYAIQSLFDIATLPFERPAPFFFYMAMIPIFTYNTETQQTADNGGINHDCAGSDMH